LWKNIDAATYNFYQKPARIVLDTDVVKAVQPAVTLNQTLFASLSCAASDGSKKNQKIL
jgi:hypothetical protein